ncbi:MAG: SRPBCC family protein [Bacteroidota bacterium]
MKSITTIGILIFALIASTSVFAQKKSQSFTVSRVIKASADKVWAVVGEDYGAIANSHPLIISSEYLDGSLEGGEGVERVCNMNESGTKYTHEKQVNFDPDNYTFRAQIFHAEGIPMVPEASFMDYKVVSIDANTSKLVMTMNFRTKPAFMGAMAKGRMQKTIEGYALAVEHHILTGETVNKDNFKGISKQYKS